MESRIEALEVQLTHISRSVDELSDLVSRQADEISALRRLLDHLRERELQRTYEADNPPPENERPPHY